MKFSSQEPTVGSGSGTNVKDRGSLLRLLPVGVWCTPIRNGILYSFSILIFGVDNLSVFPYVSKLHLTNVNSTRVGLEWF